MVQPERGYEFPQASGKIAYRWQFNETTIYRDDDAIVDLREVRRIERSTVVLPGKTSGSLSFVTIAGPTIDFDIDARIVDVDAWRSFCAFEAEAIDRCAAVYPDEGVVRFRPIDARALIPLGFVAIAVALFVVWMTLGNEGGAGALGVIGLMVAGAFGALYEQRPWNRDRYDLRAADFVEEHMAEPVDPKTDVDAEPT